MLGFAEKPLPLPPLTHIPWGLSISRKQLRSVLEGQVSCAAGGMGERVKAFPDTWLL